jgi:HlyD family secretion protein
MKKRTRGIALIVTLLLMAALAFVFRPSRVPVETEVIRTGHLQEIIEEEGKARMHDHFVLAAMVSGQLRRVDLHAGDNVKAGQTVAWIDPAPIDPRQRAVLEARVHAAQATKQQADAVAERVQAEYRQTEEDLARNKELYRHGIISKEAMDKVSTLAEITSRQRVGAEAGAQSAAYQVEETQSALLVYGQDRADLPSSILSPVSGRILRLIEQSEKVVSAGTPIVEIGYSPRLEVVADFLTRDAVRIKPGMPAMFTDWGGDKPIPARVRMVEPGAFTKISALGVEEQRVNVLCDFAGSPETLKDAYHVEVQVIVWEAPDVLLVPSSAVFRLGNEWMVFTVRDGVAHSSPLQIGHRGENQWEVIKGLRVGDVVITHPGADVKDKARVSVRG